MFDFEKRLVEISAQTILCIGDLMLDDFVYGDVSRISPEAPAPVIRVTREDVIVGGAGNVARNIASLGAKCLFVGVIGDDVTGTILQHELGKHKTAIKSHLVVDPSRPTTRKLRFVSEHFSTHLLRADWEIAKDQILIKSSQPGNKMTSGSQTGTLQLKSNPDNITLSGNGISIQFDRKDGLIHHYIINGTDFMEKGFALKPNFWRPPTDNDFGAGLQQKLQNWKRASYEYELTSLLSENEGKTTKITATYNLPYVNAVLNIVYRVADSGQIDVTQTMKHQELTAKIPMLPKFGMQLVLPESYEQVNWYGRGPGENYQDRKESTFIGLYQSTVKDQVHPYVRPQESGNKSDVRWFTLTSSNGTGLKFSSGASLNFTARPFLDGDLDDGIAKKQSHSGSLKPRPYTVLSIDLQQMGLGCIDSWGALPMEAYRLNYQDYNYQFTITPVK